MNAQRRFMGSWHGLTEQSRANAPFGHTMTTAYPAIGTPSFRRGLEPSALKRSHAAVRLCGSPLLPDVVIAARPVVVPALQAALLESGDPIRTGKDPRARASRMNSLPWMTRSPRFTRVSLG
jgi:hypothetical protein